MENLKISPDQKQKMNETLLVILIILYAAILLGIKNSETLFTTYCVTLATVFIWPKKLIYVPLIMAMIIPVIDFGWFYFNFNLPEPIEIKKVVDGVTQITTVETTIWKEFSKIDSVFYGLGGYPIYILLILILPAGFLKMAMI